MDIAINCAGIGKRYGQMWASKDIDLAIERGSVHAVVGENGAGKSTLMKIIAGVVAPDTGELSIKGTRVRDFSARAMARRGVGMVYQELMLAPTLTVWENIVLGWEPRRAGFVDERRARKIIEKMARDHQMPVPLDAVAGTLPISQQQQVEILRVLYRGADIIILDEPTSVLTPQEAEGLFETMRSLAAADTTILFISHKLHEVLAVADTTTILRHGEKVGTVASTDADPKSLARMIIGRDFQPIERRDVATGEVVLDIAHATITHDDGRTALEDVSASLRAGQILGIAGVAGSGQDELAAAVTGTMQVTGGAIDVLTESGSTVRLGDLSKDHAVRALREARMAYIPADRNNVGSAHAEGLWFSELAGKYWRRGAVGGKLLDAAAARSRARKVITRYNVKAQSADVLPGHLSGGNLQKYILGRELSADPRLIIAEEPTRGVDIGSAMAIRQEIRDRADAGAAVLLISTDLDELLELSDEILVLFGGRISGRFDRQDVDAIMLGEAMTGLSMADAPDRTDKVVAS